MNIRADVLILGLLAAGVMVVLGLAGIERPDAPDAVAALNPMATVTPTPTATPGWWSGRAEGFATPELPAAGPALPTVELSQGAASSAVRGGDGGGRGTPVDFTMVRCPNPEYTQISAVVRADPGWWNIYGSARHPDLWYWKGELSPDGQGWTPIYRQETPAQGLLMEFRTDTVPAGTYFIRLMAVDNTGNYPKPCVIQATIAQ